MDAESIQPGAARPLIYDPARHGTTTAFMTHPDFALFKREYIGLLRRIEGLDEFGSAVATHPAITSLSAHERAQLSTQLANLEDHLFSPLRYFGPHEEFMWRFGKQMIAELCDRVEEDSLPAETRAEALKQLDSLDVCQGGVTRSVRDALNVLAPRNGDLRTIAIDAKNELAKALVTDFVRIHHYKGRYDLGHEVHIVSAYLDALQMGLPPSDDLHSRSAAITGIDIGMQAFCRNMVNFNLTPLMLAEYLTNRYIASFDAAMALETQNRSEFVAAVEAHSTLQSRFGQTVDIHSLVDDRGLAIDPLLVRRDFLRGLHGLGFIHVQVPLKQLDHELALSDNDLRARISDGRCSIRKAEDQFRLVDPELWPDKRQGVPLRIEHINQIPPSQLALILERDLPNANAVGCEAAMLGNALINSDTGAGLSFDWISRLFSHHFSNESEPLLRKALQRYVQHGQHLGRRTLVGSREEELLILANQASLSWAGEHINYAASLQTFHDSLQSIGLPWPIFEEVVAIATNRQQSTPDSSEAETSDMEA